LPRCLDLFGQVRLPARVKPFRAIAYLIAGAALGVAAPAVAASANGSSIRAGIEAWQKRDYRRAVAIWQPLADRGDPDALFNMAQAYRFGRGVKANAATARTLLEKAASRGHLESRTTLGLLLLQDGDQLPALKWLKSAAEDGEPRALLVYGTALVNGDGVTQNRQLGYTYVRRAASKGLKQARATLDSLDSLMPADERRQALARYGDKAEQRMARSKSAAAKPKVTPVTAPPSSKPVSSGDWRIQLGAFARPGAAQELFAKLTARLAGREATYLPAGKVTRLIVGPYPSKLAAAAACASLTASGQPCLVIPPR
jgi:cell division septation protein DedD